MTKSVSPPRELTAHKLSGQTVNGRFLQWKKRLDSWRGDRLVAHELYSGGNWSVVRNLIETSLERRGAFKCSVISAGYGLVEIDASLAPYAATFGLGLADSVIKARGSRGPVQNAEWWEELCRWRPRGITGPRSISEAFKRRPDCVHIFALSPFYLDAIASDVSRGLSALSKPERLVIISAGKRRHGHLNESVIQAPSRLQTTLGGALTSLNVRVASAILSCVPANKLNLSTASEVVANLISKSKVRKIPDRQQLADSAVIAHIVKSLKNQPNPSYTGFLRELRGSGYACEMKRFKRLYTKVTDPI